MKLAGFSIIRNGFTYDYPFREAIASILPICEKVFVAVGKGDDATQDYMKDWAAREPKLVLIDSVWDDGLREGGRVLAVETNKAFDAIPQDFDWCIYIQGDEVLPEESYPVIKQAIADCQNDADVEGLLLKYRHFYGTYDFVADSARWYRREIRVIRNDKRIRSYRDAQGFRVDGRRKLRVRLIDAYIHHYGWVRSPQVMAKKDADFKSLWHDSEWVKAHVKAQDLFDYSQIDSLTRHTIAHPKVMAERIAQMDWQLGFDPTVKKLSLKNRLRHWLELWTGWRPFEYRNYQIVYKNKDYQN